MKRLLAAFALLFAVNAFALNTDSVSSAGFSKLTDSQKAEIISQIAKQAESNANGTTASIASSVTPENAEKWANVGSRIGQALGGAAKEVGVQVNEFAKTPVGMLTMALIVWNYIGGVVIHFFGGLFVIILGLSTIFFVMRRQHPILYEYDPERKTALGRPLVIKMERTPIDGETAAGYLACAAITIGAGLICIFTY